MKGFTYNIYFKDKPTPTDIDKIKSLLESHGQIKWDDKCLFLCGFEIKNPADNSFFSIRVFSVDTNKEEFDQESKKEFIQTLGYIPKFYIAIAGVPYAKVVEDFVVKLILTLTSIKDGKIDFTRAIDPELSNDKEKIRTLVNSIKGEVKELGYTDVKNNRWFTHIVDREFLSNWIHHDKFHVSN